ncbi:MAG: GMC family oxidoreductase [Verrucomicrobia bacterium]|nr:MAG: GMC family oxidoreductase [Verrucomicrobiota bacterium]
MPGTVTQPDPDVLIIGAGPTGAVAAKRFAEAGLSVVALEQGDWPDYSKARAEHLDFELTAGHYWSGNPNRRQAPADYPIDDEESDIDAVLYNAVGGGTVIYAAHWQRNMPSDFRVRTLDSVADDWPLTYEDLAPYYERVEADFGVSGLAGDPAFPPGQGPPLPPAPLAPMGRCVAGAHNQLGWHWWPAPNAIATRAHGPLRPCTQRATCMWGCIEGAKGSVDITHWPQNIQHGVRLVTGARVRRLETNGEGLVTGAEYVDRANKVHFQKAAVTVLAANGIGTPRLLLLSKSSKFPNGLANSSGLVGKRLMLHPFGTVVGLFAEDLGSTHGLWGQHIHCLEFYETDPARGFVRGAKWGLQPTGGPLSMTRSYPWGENNAIWGRDFHKQLRKRLGHSAIWDIIAEDLAEEKNRVVLDPVLKDADGIPAPKLIYRMSQNSGRLLQFHLQRAKESLEAAGAYEVTIAPLIRETGWHILGTCKMGTDPATSVVDAWGRCHDMPNLFIFDGSIWPTSSGMNPTATIAAMSLRCAEHLVEQRRDQKIPLNR